LDACGGEEVPVTTVATAPPKKMDATTTPQGGFSGDPENTNNGTGNLTGDGGGVGTAAAGKIGLIAGGALALAFLAN